MLRTKNMNTPKVQMRNTPANLTNPNYKNQIPNSKESQIFLLMIDLTDDINTKFK
jgi:hypothetical protein